MDGLSDVAGLSVVDSLSIGRAKGKVLDSLSDVAGLSILDGLSVVNGLSNADDLSWIASGCCCFPSPGCWLMILVRNLLMRQFQLPHLQRPDQYNQ